ncbi:ATP synthase-coupling factor 6, mitochondrial isoform X1 [Oncorhynchus keta]|uniref:ATP synthase-coupling factor 6, mitochondrial isoform X1 n=2 Tax=Oncorhynchus keta TaxID=8018 RepID=UPI00227D10EB|nr:ATP synthase-coupling factor 6, mitochondrial isoform X1 [Oncorhynchus keta]
MSLNSWKEIGEIYGKVCSTQNYNHLIAAVPQTWKSMALHKLFRLSSLLRSAVSLTLRRNFGLSAVLFNRAKDLDPIQKLFLDKIRDYSTKSKAAAGGIVDAGPSYEKGVSEEITKLQRLYGTGDLTKFPDFKFTEPQLQEVAK